MSLGRGEPRWVRAGEHGLWGLHRCCEGVRRSPPTPPLPQEAIGWPRPTREAHVARGEQAGHRGRGWNAVSARPAMRGTQQMDLPGNICFLVSQTPWRGGRKAGDRQTKENVREGGKPSQE